MVCEGQTLVNKQGSHYCPQKQALPNNHSAAGSHTTQPPTRLRVPRGDGDLLIVPPVSETREAVIRNRESFEKNKILSIRRRTARLEALEIARQYTAAICPELPPCTRCSIEELTEEKSFYVTGHQPELFHPGVWVKNVLIDELAKQNNGISLNVIIDSDAVKSHSIIIPVKKNECFIQQRIEIDHWPPGVPWEELQVIDNELFESFADRIEQQRMPQSECSVSKQFWENVVSETHKSGCVVNGLVAGRVRLERSLGINNYEVPISLLANSGSYRDFLAELILNAGQLQQIYNAILHDYRERHHIKSAMQPVPDLLQQDDWIELPIWVWNEKTKHRRSLFAQSKPGQILLSDRAGWEICIDQTEPEKSDCFRFISRHLHQLQKQGIRFRTKALMTTAYLRLFIADWFVHGIGGAKYDEITDSIITNFWNISAPQFQIATGTLWMPLENRPPAPIKSAAQLKQQLRYAKENPEILLSDSQLKTATQLLESRKKLINLQKQARTEGLSRSQRRAKFKINKQRHDQLNQIRESLRKLADKQLKQLEHEIEQTIKTESDLQVANTREYPICCYPLETLRDFEEKIRDYNF